MSFEIIGTLLAAGIQGLMLSLVGSSTSCDVTLRPAKATEPTFINATSLIEFAAPTNATGKDKLVNKLYSNLNFFI
jgi:hypothetical protein